jgi:hypothetical protein
MENEVLQEKLKSESAEHREELATIQEKLNAPISSVCTNNVLEFLNAIFHH